MLDCLDELWVNLDDPRWRLSNSQITLKIESRADGTGERLQRQKPRHGIVNNQTKLSRTALGNSVFCKQISSRQEYLFLFPRG
mmetsp:Transcript_6130/g.11399  ORF Transcript_6130/g.11399 Transcript_6130/m.11399 type:complete len:83 (+) Transcript_6130:115-363(+)